MRKKSGDMRGVYLIVILLPAFCTIKGTATDCTIFKCEKKQGNVVFGYFSGYVVMEHLQRLTKQVEVNQTKERDCVKMCVRNIKCHTVSVVPIKNSTNVTCYLSGSSIYVLRPIPKKGSKIIAMGTPACQSSPCQNGGSCHPNYKTGGFRCTCRANWIGKLCERTKPDLLPDITIMFDKDKKPNTNKKSSIGLDLAKNGGKVVYVPDTKVPVYMASSSGSGLSYTITSGSGVIGNILVGKKITIGFWLKYPGHFVDKQFVILAHLYWALYRIGSEIVLITQHAAGTLTLTCDLGSSKNKWNHIILIYGQVTTLLYLNGGECAKSVEILNHKGGHPSAVQVFSPSKSFRVGFIDSITVYHIVMKLQHVKKWYNKEKGNYLQ